MSPAKKAAMKAVAKRSSKRPAVLELDVRKTYKLYIGGAFPRSESGRSYPVFTTDRRFVANAVLASRKDVRDAVKVARDAQGSWANRSAYNRGQILYRVAEIMQGRRGQFVDELSVGGSRDPERETDAAIDRWVWYAGWADKYAQILGSANPVDGPYFNFTTPEAAGVVALVAPNDAPLLALVSRMAPAIVAGNTIVALASERWPLVAVNLAEALATSDVPGGVVNILTGKAAELVPWMAGHADVNVVDLSGVSGELRADAERRASDAVARVVAASATERRWFDDRAESPYLIAGFCEYKTVWHPKGA
ncbi:MAG TPA: aldehyde dehydrogenase family protein [Acidimicrobiales bacterium]|nr:aldehyde dehydrogenase family protein [Acidimicrobiales bacterium]